MNGLVLFCKQYSHNGEIWLDGLVFFFQQYRSNEERWLNGLVLFCQQYSHIMEKDDWMAWFFFANNTGVMEEDGWMAWCFFRQQYSSNRERWLDGLVLFSSIIQKQWRKMAGWLCVLFCFSPFSPTI